MSDQFWSDKWAVVHLVNHEMVVGKVSETRIAGGGFLRVDALGFNDGPGSIRFFNESMIRCIFTVSELAARKIMSGDRVKFNSDNEEKKVYLS